MSRIDPYSTVNVLRIVKSLCSIFIRMRSKRSAYAMAVVMRNVTLLPVSSRIQSTAYQIVWIAITCQLGCVTHTLSIRRCEHAVPFTNTCKWWDCDIFGGNWRMGQTLYICMQADSAMQNLIYARHRIKYYSYAFNRISCRDSFIFIWLIFYSLIQTVFFQWNRVFKQWHEIHRNSFIVWVLKWIVNGVTYRIVIVY